jgi:hypothetical protein
METYKFPIPGGEISGGSLRVDGPGAQVAVACSESRSRPSAWPKVKVRGTPQSLKQFLDQSNYPSQGYVGMAQNLVTLVNIKIARKWMFIPLKMVFIGIDPWLCVWGTKGFERLKNMFLRIC